MTDEIFAVASTEKSVSRLYFLGLATMPFCGWTLGTLLGAVLGNVLPSVLTNALGIALYAMFIAIVLPAAREEGKTALCVLVSALISCAFFYIPALAKIPSGFTVIIIAVAVSLAFAYLFPIKDEEVTGDA